MGLSVAKRRFSIAEYLELEEKSVDRHEFHEGEVLAMSGGMYGHSRINANLLAAVHSRLSGKECHALDSNLRVRIHNRQDYVYPDISVVCGTAEFDENDPKKTTIINPSLVVEVLSDSTESYDRGAKSDLYRQIPSLKQYVLVSQYEPMVETFLKQPKGKWLLQVHKGKDEAVELSAIGIVVPLKDIYAGIELPGGK